MGAYGISAQGVKVVSDKKFKRPERFFWKEML